MGKFLFKGNNSLVFKQTIIPCWLAGDIFVKKMYVKS